MMKKCNLFRYLSNKYYFIKRLECKEIRLVFFGDGRTSDNMAFTKLANMKVIGRFVNARNVIRNG